MMRVVTCCLLLAGLVAGPAQAQEIPDRALPTLKAAPQLPANLKKKKAKAPSVVRPATWWGKRSGISQKMLAGGGLSVLGGTALVAVGASMANNAIDRRTALQNKVTLTDVERTEFTEQSSSVETGKTLHLSGLILCGAGAVAAGLGSVL
jgi:hypothetical protein